MVDPKDLRQVSADHDDARATIPTPPPVAEPLTDAELSAIDARANAATPGPWAAEPYQLPPGRTRAGSPQGRVHADWFPIAAHVFLCDGAFIAAAREDVPRLLAEVQRLRARAEAAEQEREALRFKRDVLRAEVEELRRYDCRRAVDAVAAAREERDE